MRRGVERHERGAFSDEAEAASLIELYEAWIAALERMVGRLALENELVKGASATSRTPGATTRSVVTGPAVFPSPKDAA